jgi:hypothetical protein
LLKSQLEQATLSYNQAVAIRLLAAGPEPGAYTDLGGQNASSPQSAPMSARSAPARRLKVAVDGEKEVLIAVPEWISHNSSPARTSWRLGPTIR